MDASTRNVYDYIDGTAPPPTKVEETHRSKHPTGDARGVSPLEEGVASSDHWIYGDGYYN
eukprot:4525312-Pyramimonas_sp.AAC.1